MISLRSKDIDMHCEVVGFIIYFDNILKNKFQHLLLLTGFLWQLLCEISSLHSNAMQESGTQTDLIKIGVVSELGRLLRCYFTFGTKS
jgi:hypothetical protein